MVNRVYKMGTPVTDQAGGRKRVRVRVTRESKWFSMRPLSTFGPIREVNKERDSSAAATANGSWLSAAAAIMMSRLSRCRLNRDFSRPLSNCGTIWQAKKNRHDNGTGMTSVVKIRYPQGCIMIPNIHRLNYVHLASQQMMLLLYLSPVSNDQNNLVANMYIERPTITQ